MIHAGIFADIILQLVETSTTKLTEASTCRFSPPTEDRTELVPVIELVLEAGKMCCSMTKLIYHHLSACHHKEFVDIS